MNFQSSYKIITNQSLWHYSFESTVLQKTPLTCFNCYLRSSVAIYRGVCTGARRRRRVGGGKAAGKHPGVRAHPLVAVVVREAARTGAGGGCSSGGSCTSSSTAASMAADGGFGRAQAAPAVRGRATASHVLCLALAWLVVAAGGGRSWSCLLQPWRDRAHARALESERERAESERECQREGRVPVLNLSTARWPRGASRDAWRPRELQRQSATVQHFQNSNTTAKIQAKIPFSSHHIS